MIELWIQYLKKTFIPSQAPTDKHLKEAAMQIGLNPSVYTEKYSSPSQPGGQAQLAERREVVKAVRELEKTPIAGDGNELRLALDRDTKRPVVRIVNRETGELIQQFPTEEVIRLAQRLKAAR
jgi:uncharacterized FlaG/YvyC family protein